MRFPRWLPLLIALLIYSAAALYHLHLPGLHQDEAQEAGLMGMQIAEGQPLSLFRGLDSAVVLQNRAWPLMVQEYIGSLYVYLAWIAFGVGGVSVESLRAMTVLIGLLSLVTAYGAAGTLFGRRVAALTVLLLSIHPSYVFWTRQGVYVTSYTIPLALGALWLMALWWKGSHAWTLCLAAFLMGVGLWGKLLFIWFMGAVFIAWVLLNAPHWFTRLRGRYVGILIAIFCGLIGLAPLIRYNLNTGGTLDNLFGNFDQSYYGVDNSNVAENFQERLTQAPTVFESSQLRELGGLFRNPFARAWLYLSTISCGLAAFINPQKRGVRLFILLVVLLMVAQSSFTSTALWFTHFALILPFMVILGAVGAEALFDLLSRITKQPKLAGLIVAGLVGLLFAFDAQTIFRYHQALEKTSGIATHSAVIYDLAEVLDEAPPGTPIAALDWGISPAVGMLTEGRVLPNEIFGYTWETDPGFPARIAPFFTLENSLYVLHVPGETVFPRRDAFIAEAEAQGKTPELLLTLPDRAGNPYFEIWTAR